MPQPDKIVKGTVSVVRDKYVVRFGTRSEELPVNLTVPEAEIKKLVDKEVAVALAPGRNGAVIAIGTWPTPELPRFRCVLCYVPPPDIFKVLNPVVQEAVVRQMVNERMMSPGLAKELTGKTFRAPR